MTTGKTATPVTASTRPEPYRVDTPLFEGYNVKRDRHHEYDMARLRNWGWMMLWHRTLFTNAWALLAIVLSVVGLTALALVSCEPPDPKNPQNPPPAPVIDLGFCVTLQDSQTWFTFTTLTSFLLSLFVNNIFFRWWQMREKVQGLVAAMMNASMKMAGITRAQGPLQSNDQCMRYLCLVYALALKMFRREELSRGPPLTQVTLPDSSQLVTDEEWMELQECGGVSYLTVMSWLCQLTNGDGKLAGGVLGRVYTGVFMHFDLADAQKAIQSVEVFLAEQIPYTYVQFLVLLTRVHILFVHLYCAALIGQAVERTSNGSVSASWEKLLQGYMIMIFNFFLYNGMLVLANLLENPFGNDQVDWPVQKMWVNTVEAMYSCIKSQPHFLAVEDTSRPLAVANVSEQTRATGTDQEASSGRDSAVLLVPVGAGMALTGGVLSDDADNAMDMAEEGEQDGQGKEGGQETEQGDAQGDVATQDVAGGDAGGGAAGDAGGV